MCTLYTFCVILYSVAKAKLPEMSQGESPKSYLERIVNDANLPAQMRLEAAKALLPYTAQKTSETLEVHNRNYVIKDERLKDLNDDELRTLIELVKKIAEPRLYGDGVAETEVQHD